MCTHVFSGHTHGQLLMPVHQLWLLLPVTALCVGEREQLLYEQGLTHDVEALFFRVVAYSIFFVHKVQKQAPASLNFLVTPATKRLTVLPYLFYPCPAPFIFQSFINILLSFGVMSLYSGIYAR